MTSTNQVLENRTTRLLSQRYRIDKNEWKTSIANSPKHEGLKKRIFNWLVKNGYNVVCEATFKTGGRADLLVLNPALAIEVLVSETQERFDAKDYPVPTIAVREIKEIKEVMYSPYVKVVTLVKE